MKSTRLLPRCIVLLCALAIAGCAPPATPNPFLAQPSPSLTVTPLPATPTHSSPGVTPAATPTRPPVVLEPPAGPPLALVGGLLVDGTGAAPLPDAVVLIDKGRILAVGSRTQLPVPAWAKVIDVHGATILPGFFNTHVHLGYNKENLEAWAQAGVTTVRDLGAIPDDDLFSRRDAVLKDNRYARLIAAGPMVTVRGGYPIAPWGMGALVVTSPEDAAAKTTGLIDAGADVVKISLESGSIFERKLPVLTADEAARVVQAAHARDIPVSAHVTRSADLVRALDAGVDDIAHMVTDDVPGELIDRMIDQKVSWVPTVELWKGVGYFDEQAMANLRRFVEAGGQVALGTDYAGYSAQFDLGMPIREVEWMREAGMTPMQVIVAATRNAAHVCNLEHELGTVEPGKIADILVVDGNPLEDLRALTRVRLVIHNGQVIRDTPD